MKLLQATLAAALAVSSLAIGGVATAQGMHQDQGRGDHDRGDRGDRNDHRGYNDNRGRHNGWNNGHHNRGGHCWTTWRHHHRVRVCR